MMNFPLDGTISPKKHLIMSQDTIQKGKVVGFSYILTNSSGEVLDKSDTPLEYLHGWQNIIPGLEKELTGMQIGQKKSVVVPPEEAYGEVQESMKIKVPKSELESDELVVGMQFESQTKDGVTIFTVQEIFESEVLLDGNHPLAGETLHFSVEIASIRDSSKEEQAHGHAHGPGGHHHH
jgi:FKBP-type peptidyl-prolyl cis-trans isomerase SlyD